MTSKNLVTFFSSTHPMHESSGLFAYEDESPDNNEKRVTLRMTNALHSKLSSQARENNNSINTEILKILQDNLYSIFYRYSANSLILSGVEKEISLMLNCQITNEYEENESIPDYKISDILSIYTIQDLDRLYTSNIFYIKERANQLKIKNNYKKTQQLATGFSLDLLFFILLAKSDEIEISSYMHLIQCYDDKNTYLSDLNEFRVVHFKLPPVFI